MVETAFSAFQHRFGSVLRLGARCRQVRQLLLTATVYDIKRSLDDQSLPRSRIQQRALIGYDNPYETELVTELDIEEQHRTFWTSGPEPD